MKIIGLISVVLYKIRKRAIDWGFNPKIDSEILASYVQNTPRFDQPGISLEKHDEIIAKVTQNWFGQEKSIWYIASKLQISQQSMFQIFKKHGYEKIKPM